MPREEERTESGVEAITSSSFALWHDLKYRSGQDETRGEREKYLIYQTQSRFFTASRHDRGGKVDG